MTVVTTSYPLSPFWQEKTGGIVDTMYTNPLAVNIILVEVDTSLAIKPIKGPVQAPITLSEMMPWILGGLLLVAIAVAILFYLRRRKPEAPTVRPKPREPAHVIALRELDRLKTEKLWQSGDIKGYHSRLTDIVRAYLEHQYNIPAQEQTSDEILGAIVHSGLDRQLPFENLERMLRLADLVKFAKGKPKPDENAEAIDKAYDFVQQTIRRTAITETTEPSETEEKTKVEEQI